MNPNIKVKGDLVADVCDNTSVSAIGNDLVSDTSADSNRNSLVEVS